MMVDWFGISICLKKNTQNTQKTTLATKLITLENEGGAITITIPPEHHFLMSWAVVWIASAYLVEIRKPVHE
jgi:hypothetical protein